MTTRKLTKVKEMAKVDVILNEKLLYAAEQRGEEQVEAYYEVARYIRKLHNENRISAEQFGKLNTEIIHLICDLNDEIETKKKKRRWFRFGLVALAISAFFIGRLSVTHGHETTVSAATTETETTSENANQEPMIPLSECIPLADIACQYTSYTGYMTFELMDTTRQFDDVNGNLYSEITKDIPDATQEYTENVIDLNSITDIQVNTHSVHITANDGNEYILDLDVD